MHIVIAGGGLTGLSAALELNDHQVTIIDARQEIGSPTRSPGYISDISLIPIDEFEFLQLKGNCFRRSWLEKQMAIQAIENGVEIIVKTRIVGFQDGFNLRGAGAGSLSSIKGDVYIDALGNKSLYPGWSGDSGVIDDIEMIRPPTRDIIEWQGGIMNMESDWMRADGTSEIWWRNEPPVEPVGGWLERMSGEHPLELGADAAIIRGIESARKVN
jgi:flavin-dependent dehydrogenase|tara:strand:+ start:48 stop:692 length:645 start_codon:yes stop_codon:yes gene_type:complete